MEKKILATSLCIIIGALACLTMSFRTAGDVQSDACITKSFAAYEDGEVIATFDLYSNCTFKYVNKEEQPYQTTRGTYTLEDGAIERGCTLRLIFHFDGLTDYGTLVWPLKQDLMLLVGDFDFYPVR